MSRLIALLYAGVNPYGGTRTHKSVYRMSDRELAEYKSRRMKAQIRVRLLRKMSLIACLILVCTFSAQGISTKASSEPEDIYYKYFTLYEVQYGDTLWDIAGLYMDENYDSTKAYVKEVVAMNHLEDSNSIKTGQVICVPYYSKEYKL